MHALILGCGYVGTAVGRRLLAAGHEVTGIRRTTEGVETLRQHGLKAIRADITDSAALADLPDADWLIYSASVGRSGTQSARNIFVDGLEQTIATVGAREKPPDRFIYTSSTGVYGDHNGAWVDESTDPCPLGERGQLLVEAEHVALNRAADHGIDPTVVRFGGLYGPTRYGLHRYLDRPVTAGYRNATHRDDAAGAIAHLLIEEKAREETVLVVDDEPADRWAFAEWLADACEVNPPQLVTIEERLQDTSLSATAVERIRSNKRCRNTKLRALGYDLEMPTVWAGYQSAIERYRSDTS